jgi:hypothetical protein
MSPSGNGGLARLAELETDATIHAGECFYGFDRIRNEAVGHKFGLAGQHQNLVFM